MSNRMLEMAVVIKGRLDGSLGSSAQRAAKQLSDLQTASRTLTRQLREQERQLARERAAGSVNESTLRRQLELQQQLNDTVRRRAQLTEALSNRQAAAGQLQTNAGRLAGAAAAAAAVAAPVVDAIGVAAEYEAAMSKVKAITNSTDEDMRKLDATAKEMGATTQFSARQAAEAMSYLGMAGWKTNEIIAGMPGMLGLAAAGGVDLARVADILSDDLTAFGLSADKAGHMADVFAHVITNTNTDVEKMGETMKYAAPVAAAFGASMEETAAMTGLMANAGIKASQAGTSLRAGFLRLAGPPKMAQKAMAELGVEMSDITKQQAETSATLQALGIDMEKMSDMSGPHKMIAVITELQQKMQGLSDEEQLSHLKAIFGTEAATGWLNVIKAGPDALAKLTAELEHCDGEAQRVAKTMTDNAKGAWIKLQSAVEGVAISVGSLFLPMLTKLGEALAEKVADIAKWVEAHQDITKAAAIAVAAIMSLILAFFTLTTVVSAINFVKTSWTLFMATVGGEAAAGAGALAMLKGAFMTAFKGIGTAILGPLKFIGGVLLHAFLGMVSMVQSLFAGQFVAVIRNGMAMLRSIFLTNPWGWALLALAALLVLVMNNWEKFREVVSIVMDHVSGTVDAAIARIKQAFGTALDKVTEVWNSITGQSASAAEVVGQIFNTLGWLIGGAFDIVVGSVTTAISVIVNLFASMAQIIGGIINVVVGIITLDMNKVCQGIGQTIDGVLSATLDTIKTIMGGIGDIFDMLLGKADEVQAKAEQAASAAAGAQMSNADAMRGLRESSSMQIAAEVAAIPMPDTSAAQAQVAALGESATQTATATQQNAAALEQYKTAVEANGQGMEQYAQMIQQGGQSMAQLGENLGTALPNVTQFSDAAGQATPNLAKLSETVGAGSPLLQQHNELVGAGNPLSAQHNELMSAGNALLAQFKEAVASAVATVQQFASALTSTNEGLALLGSSSSAAASAISSLGIAAQGAVSTFQSAASSVAAAAANAGSGANVAHNAKGGIYSKGAFLTTFAEDSPEAAIPLDGTKRAVSLWRQAGEMLGILPKRIPGGDGTATAEQALQNMPTLTTVHMQKPPMIPDIQIPELVQEIPSMGNILPDLAGMAKRAASSILGKGLPKWMPQGAGFLGGMFQRPPLETPIPMVNALPQDIGMLAELAMSGTEGAAEAPMAMEPPSIGDVHIEYHAPSITINGTVDSGTVSQIEDVLAKAKDEWMREVERMFPSMQKNFAHQGRRLSYAT